MKKGSILFPLTVIGTALAAVGGAVFLAKNKKVRSSVSDVSYKLLHEVSGLVDKAKTKLDESDLNKNDKFISFLNSSVEGLSKKLKSVNKSDVTEAFEVASEKINDVITKFEEVKEKNIDPILDSIIDSLKEARKKLKR